MRCSSFTGVTPSLALYRVRHRVVSSRTQRMASADPPHREEQSGGAVSRKRVAGIRGTGRDKPAVAAKKWRDQPLVEPDEEYQRLRHGIALAISSRSAKTSACDIRASGGFSTKVKSPDTNFLRHASRTLRFSAFLLTAVPRRLPATHLTAYRSDGFADTVSAGRQRRTVCRPGPQ